MGSGRLTWADAFHRGKKYQKWQRVAKGFVIVSTIVLAVTIYFFEKTAILPLIAFSLLVIAVAAYATIYFVGVRPATKDRDDASDS